METKDLFSSLSKNYETFRPTYPLDLFKFIYSHTKSFEVAWDCATGNGQAATDLAKQFRKVYATDLSEKQILSAKQATNVEYSVCHAEQSHFPAGSFDLITVAQAAHWLNFELFYQEVRRVAKPNSVLALWGYGLLNINPVIDELIKKFYTQTIGSYWDPERKLIDLHYQTIPFPFEEIPSPTFQISVEWTIYQLQGYLTTWSSVQKYIHEKACNPVDELMAQIEPLWVVEKMKISFPLFVRMGRVTS